MLFFFPTGRAYPQRFQRWISLVFVVSVLTGLVSILGQPTLNGPNALYRPEFAPLSALLDPVTVFLNTCAAVVGLISILLRYRAAGYVERLQLKWLAWGSAITITIFLTWVFALNLFGGDSVYFLIAQTYVYIFPALTIGIAILRHRLYDIDIIIRRTLIYSVLTAILALVYFGGVVVAQGLLRTVTGGNSDAAIVISTLVIAALFTPLRRRVQNVIDRRFYRRKYNAERTLAAFNATMRDEVDLDKLQAALVNVVQETMQPKVVMLWVREQQKAVSEKIST